jgi:hypothetical protein
MNLLGLKLILKVCDLGRQGLNFNLIFFIAALASGIHFPFYRQSFN